MIRDPAHILDYKADAARIKDRFSTIYEWYETNGRHFAWRNTTGWPLAVAEVLLQKTRGSSVDKVWHEFVGRYPTEQAFLAAKPKRVQDTVGQLGLRNQRYARLGLVARSIRGQPPGTGSGLGQYGEGVLSLSMGRLPKAPPVDGNVARVLSRVQNWLFDRGEPRKKRPVLNLMAQLLRVAKPNQRLSLVYALVDLGATVCLPRVARCSACPMSAICRWEQSSRGHTARSVRAS